TVVCRKHGREGASRGEVRDHRCEEAAIVERKITAKDWNGPNENPGKDCRQKDGEIRRNIGSANSVCESKEGSDASYSNSSNCAGSGHAADRNQCAPVRTGR